MFIQENFPTRNCDMKGYVKSYNIGEHPHRIILHIDNNDFNSESNPESVMKSVLDLTGNLISVKKKDGISGNLP